ncbi:PREDICTED: calcyclin-binding protein-like, partial [Rhagoletis zephyria]|uniref:calcyclin-binding protein-like n=1 Tax=Rhagoletis zephyria TaxID=28612 RepID=UPI0008116487
LLQLSEEIAELSQFVSQAKLSNNKVFLEREINRLKTRKTNLEKELEKIKAAVSGQSAQTASSSELGIILVTNYMWDQTNDFVKIYIEVDKNQKIENDQLSIKFVSNTSFTCVFGKFRFTLGRLCKDVNTEKSTVKITKSNRVIITLYKKVAENWPSLNVSESALKKSPLGDPSEAMGDDPSGGIMKLMKNMYDEGDDEMKRTIMKTYYESQQKQGQGLDPTAMNF